MQQNDGSRGRLGGACGAGGGNGRFRGECDTAQAANMDCPRNTLALITSGSCESGAHFPVPAVRPADGRPGAGSRRQTLADADADHHTDADPLHSHSTPTPTLLPLHSHSTPTPTLLPLPLCSHVLRSTPLHCANPSTDSLYSACRQHLRPVQPERLAGERRGHVTADRKADGRSAVPA